MTNLSSHTTGHNGLVYQHLPKKSFLSFSCSLSLQPQPIGRNYGKDAEPSHGHEETCLFLAWKNLEISRDAMHGKCNLQLCHASKCRVKRLNASTMKLIPMAKEAAPNVGSLGHIGKTTKVLPTTMCGPRMHRFHPKHTIASSNRTCLFNDNRVTWTTYIVRPLCILPLPIDALSLFDSIALFSSVATAGKCNSWRSKPGWEDANALGGRVVIPPSCHFLRLSPSAYFGLTDTATVCGNSVRDRCCTRIMVCNSTTLARIVATSNRLVAPSHASWQAFLVASREKTPWRDS